MNVGEYVDTNQCLSRILDDGTMESHSPPGSSGESWGVALSVLGMFAGYE